MSRRTRRRAEQTRKKMLEGGSKGPEGQHILGSSQAEALASLREMPLPPAPPGAGDMGDRDRVNPVAYRVAKNERKRARRRRSGR